MTEALRYEVADGIGTITLNRPASRNALTLAMYDRLAEVATAASADPTLRCLIVTGAGDRAFAAGTDINEFTAFRDGADGVAYEARIERAVGALEACPRPVIAAIAGACTGGGAAIAAVCDIRIGAANTRIGMPIARTLGNCLSMANYTRLAALLGPARVIELVFTARLIEAPEALATGLLSEVVTDRAALDARAMALARTLSGHAPLTLWATKTAMRRLRAAQPDGDDLVARCFGSADFREGVGAFLAGRAPEWRGN